jgi:hypothetical protein
MRTPLAALGVQSDLDMCVPWSLAAFWSKARGCVLPWGHVAAGAGDTSPGSAAEVEGRAVAGDITWQLIPEARS